MADMEESKLLLLQTEKLLAARCEQLRRTGGNFNIFSILGVVKINAGDWALQVKHYASFTIEQANNSRIFYLTLDGHDPSEESTGGDGHLDISWVSFAREIRKWLERCGEIAWEAPTVSGVIRQYISLIDKLTGNLGDEYMDIVRGMVGSSRASFESAPAVSDAVTGAKADLIRNVFSGIERHIYFYLTTDDLEAD